MGARSGVLRGRTQVRALAGHRAGAHRRARGGRAGQRPAVLRWGSDRTGGGEAHADGRPVRQFHLPIVSLVDQPGFMIRPQAEESATIRRGARAICAVMRWRVSWMSVIVRKTQGVAGAAHFGPSGITLAWPSAQTGALPLGGGVAMGSGARSPPRPIRTPSAASRRHPGLAPRPLPGSGVVQRARPISSSFPSLYWTRHSWGRCLGAPGLDCPSPGQLEAG